MKRVLVTGAGGFVGARILDMWRGQFALCAFPSDTLRTADESAVLRFILKEHPDVIVHTAALSNTQYCQQEPEDSFRANVLLPEWVAKGAEEVGAKLLSCSSDQVYAGVTQRGALAETLPLSPSNVYGRHKLEAEARVLARCPDAVALRLPWMYDLPGYHLPIRGNLPLTLIRKPIKNQFIQSFLYYVPYVTLAVMTFPAIVNATQSPAAGAVALVVGIAAAWFGASLFQVSVACCAVVFVLELFLVH